MSPKQKALTPVHTELVISNYLQRDFSWLAAVNLTQSGLSYAFLVIYIHLLFFLPLRIFFIDMDEVWFDRNARKSAGVNFLLLCVTPSRTCA